MPDENIDSNDSIDYNEIELIMRKNMATLTIRNLDDDVRDFLRQQAATHGQSMEAEVREILVRVVKRRQTKPGDVFRRIHAQFAGVGSIDDLELPKRTPMPEPVAFDE